MNRTEILNNINELFEIQENGVTDYYLDCSGAFIDEQEEYDLLKEAFKNAK